MKIEIKNCEIMQWKDGGAEFLRGSIAIGEGSIRSIGEIPKSFSPDRVIDAGGALALPGLVNAHTHVSMSLLRNLADDLELMKWLQDKVWPIEEKMSEEDVHIGALISMVEMIHSGITAFADMYFSMDQVAAAAAEAGLRANIGVGLTGDGETSKPKLQSFREFYDRYNGKADGRIIVDLAPHAPYTCDGDCLSAAAGVARDLGCGLHIHLAETSGEVDECKKRYGLSPIFLAERAGLFEGRAIAAHCVHVDEADIELLADKGVHVIHNPTSNLKLASGFAPTAAMIEAGVSLAIGTDGPASNNNQNMLEEIHLAAILAKAVSGDPTAMPAAQALQIATEGGSKALGLAEAAGSLSEGAPADLLLLRTDKAHMRPLHDPVAAVVYGAGPSDIDTLICDGKVIMTGGIIETLDEEEIIKKAQEAASRLVSR